MIKRSLTSKIDLKLSPFGWRFTDIKWDLLPDAIQRQIYAMPEAISQEIQAQSRQFHHVGWRDFNMSDYQIVAKQSLEENEATSNHLIKSWLLQMDISGEQFVYISWDSLNKPVACIAKWLVFVEYWNSFFYPFDLLNIFDDTMQWAILCGPEEEAVYVKRHNESV